MKKDNSGWILIAFFALFLVIVAVVASVLCSDMPIWAKWLILMR